MRALASKNQVRKGRILTRFEAGLLQAGTRRLGTGLLGLLVLMNLGALVFLLTDRGGTLLSIDQELHLRWPVWDSRINIPALANALVLGLAGLLLYRCELRYVDRKAWAGRFVGASLLFMAADELLEIHETLERWTGIDWQVLYLPVFAAIGIGTLFLLRRWWAEGLRGAAATFLTGSAAWVIAQVLEKLQWNGDVRQPNYWAYVFVEESLEFIGSALFLLAVLTVIRRRIATHWPDDGEHYAAR